MGTFRINPNPKKRRRPFGPTQQQVLKLLRTRDRDVAELASMLLKSPSAIYQVAASLLEAGAVVIVDERRLHFVRSTRR